MKLRVGKEVFEVSITQETFAYKILDITKMGAWTGENLPIGHGGFRDSHLHLGFLGEVLNSLDLKKISKREDALEQALIFLKNKTPSAPISIYGWDASLGNFEQWCEVLPQSIPWIVHRVCGHVGFCSASFSGKPQWLEEQDFFDFLAARPSWSHEIRNLYYESAKTLLLRNQIFEIGDMSLTDEDINFLQSREFPFFIQGVAEGLRCPQLLKSGPLRNKHFQVEHWKTYLDGSLGAGTAWTSWGMGTCCIPNVSKLSWDCKQAIEKGFALSFHAIGDLALDLALDLGEKFLPIDRQMKHRLEHVQTVRPDQIERMSRNRNLWELHVQPRHKVEDQSFFEKQIPQKFQSWMYRLKSFVDAGLLVKIGSDSPIADLNPKKTLEAMTGGLAIEERLKFDAALSLYTLPAKLALGERLVVSSAPE